MGLPVFPPELANEAAYEAEIARLDGEIAVVEKHVQRLRRERGCRVIQLESLKRPLAPASRTWAQRVQDKLKRLLG